MKFVLVFILCLFLAACGTDAPLIQQTGSNVTMPDGTKETVTPLQIDPILLQACPDLDLSFDHNPTYPEILVAVKQLKTNNQECADGKARLVKVIQDYLLTQKPSTNLQ